MDGLMDTLLLLVLEVQLLKDLCEKIFIHLGGWKFLLHQKRPLHSLPYTVTRSLG